MRSKNILIAHKDLELTTGAKIKMDRTFNKASNHKEAEFWDIIQQIKMTPRQRQRIAFELKKRFYGKNVPDVRDSMK